VRIARVAAGESTFIARIEGDTATPVIEAPGGLGRDALRDALAAGVDLTAAPAVGDPAPLDSFTLKAPVTAPSKLLAIGLNYADHARESGLEPPAAPIVFVKTPNSIVGPGEAIRYAKDDTDQVDYEAELAVVIGRRARRVSEADALDYVFGYTACNDVSARDAQFSDGQWTRGKSFDTFCPLGPWIVTADEVPDPQALRISCRVNGQTLQDSTTGEMIFGVAAIISYLSRFMTLEPGDVIATGTPFGVGFARTPPVFLLNGDTVDIDIEGVGVLTNPVVVE
jgi:2-keto-4-pentenoate hydratase/2-oxohepta-3-ene-1,7-dioic acid hydratase in catechol pathway